MEDLRCSKVSDLIIHRIVNSICASNTYILEYVGSPYVWLVDIGDFEAVLKYSEGKQIKGVFITHTHFDHIYGLNKLVNNYPECQICISEKGYLGLYNDKLNLSKYHHESFKLSGGKVVVLKDNESMELFHNVTLRSIATPGHDWSSMTYVVGNNLLTGDSYIPGLKVFTSFPKSNQKEAEYSLKKIMHLAKNRNLYPGHGLCYINRNYKSVL